MALDLLAVVPLLTWPALARQSGAPPSPLATGHPLPPLQRIRLHNCVVRRIREVLEREGYVEVPVPSFAPVTGCDGIVDAGLALDCGGDLAFPRQTGRPCLDEYLARGMDAAYCEGQRLRREPGGLTESRWIEVGRRDLALEGLCDLQERLLKDIALHVSADEIGGAHVTRLDWMARWEHPRLTYRDAIDVLRRHGFALAFGDELDREAQAALVRYCGSLPVHVTHFPESSPGFAARLDRSDPSIAERVDYVLPFAGATFSGGRCEADPKILRRRLLGGATHERLMACADELARRQWAAGNACATSAADLAARHRRALERALEGYLGIFEQGTVERAGFGLGVARLLQYLLALGSEADAIVHPATATLGAASD
jgi:aspartyl/asparaginyl-tRNA synthetase